MIQLEGREVTGYDINHWSSIMPTEYYKHLEKPTITAKFVQVFIFGAVPDQQYKKAERAFTQFAFYDYPSIYS